jgi:acetyl-CoA acyltransferase 1
MQRIQTVAGHVSAAPGSGSSAAQSRKSPDDVVICCAYRTALTKAKRGAFAKTSPEDLLAPLFKACLDRTGIKPATIGDIQIGNVLQTGSGMISARMAGLMAGIPDSTPVMSINRQCSSGLQAVANIANAIIAGQIDAGIGGGVESMSMFDMMASLDITKVSSTVFDHEGARNCLIPMGMTSENVAEKFGIPRKVQDQLAVESHAKAVRAQENGWYDSEIVPVTIEDAKNPGKTITVTKDEGMRKGTTLESLSTLGPSFKKNGTTTAGNSSQLTDGAAVVLLARRSFAESQKLPIIGKFVAFAAVGCPPEIMGIGPAVAIPAVLKKANLTIDDIDIFEINEAFGSQATYCVNHLGVPKNKLNPKGGAIALGHPLGCTGARQIATLMPELKRTKTKRGIVSMCIGAGMGAAGIFESEQ